MHPLTNPPEFDRAEPSIRQLRAFFQAAVAGDLPVALWRLPFTDGSHGIVDFSGAAEPAPIDFCTGEPGFVLAPFVNEDNRSALRIRADLHLAPNGLHTRRKLWNGQRGRFERFSATYQALLMDEPCGVAAWYTSPGRSKSHCSSQTEYRDLVRQAIEFISESGLDKVVVSRMSETALPRDFDPVATFQRLCNRYPAAFVSLVAVPGVGTWIGASPELLLADNGASLRTMALAGTQARPVERPLTEVAWSQKEVEEQALVSDYVRDFFQRAGVANVEESGPHTVAAGNIVHLQTAFRVALPHDQRMTLANRVLHELHPTSAVCGMPKDKALAFILRNERYDRSFYSGFLGPVYLDGQSHLYVNLRCMQIGERVAALYVGGGVTADSDPDAEWRETELKAETLLAVLCLETSVSPTQSVHSQAT